MMPTWIVELLIRLAAKLLASMLKRRNDFVKSKEPEIMDTIPQALASLNSNILANASTLNTVGQVALGVESMATQAAQAGVSITGPQKLQFALQLIPAVAPQLVPALGSLGPVFAAVVAGFNLLGIFKPSAPQAPTQAVSTQPQAMGSENKTA